MSGGEPPHVLVHTSGCGQHDQSEDVTSNICSPSWLQDGYTSCGYLLRFVCSRVVCYHDARVAGCLQRLYVVWSQEQIVRFTDNRRAVRPPKRAGHRPP